MHKKSWKVPPEPKGASYPGCQGTTFCVTRPRSIFGSKIDLFFFRYLKKVKICQFYGMLFGIEIEIMQPIAHFGNWPFNDIFFISRPFWGLIWIQVDTFWIQVIQMDRAWNSDQFTFLKFENPSTGSKVIGHLSWTLFVKISKFLAETIFRNKSNIVKSAKNYNCLPKILTPWPEVQKVRPRGHMWPGRYKNIDAWQAGRAKIHG